MTLFDFPTSYEVARSEDRATYETIRKARVRSHHRFFKSEEETNAFKARRQASGCVASVRPVLRSVADRQRHYERCQVELTATESWPLQARRISK